MIVVNRPLLSAAFRDNEKPFPAYFFLKKTTYTNLTHILSQNAINVLHLKVVHVLAAMPFMHTAIPFWEHAIIYQ